MNALDLLTADHNRVRGLFARFEEAEESGDSQVLAELGTTILTELEVHTTIEEEIFYPAVSNANEEVHDLITEGIEEHHVVKTLGEEIKALSPGGEVWVAKAKVMIENVEHHAEEEETDMFPAVRKALSVEALIDLGAQMEARKASLGAPTVADKEQLTVDELQRLAREQQIPGRSEMNRQELLATVAPG